MHQATDIATVKTADIVPSNVSPNLHPAWQDLGGLARRWAAYIDASPRTVRAYTRAAGRFCSWARSRGISMPSRADVIAYRDEMAATLAPATCRLYMCAVRQFLGWLEQEGVVARNVAARVKGARGRSSNGFQRGHLTSAQCARLLDGVDRSTVAGKRDYAMILLMMVAGLRTIEVSRANVGDIQTAGNARILKVWGKGRQGADDLVVLPAVAEAAIADYLAARRGGSQDGSPLFRGAGNRNRGRISTRSISWIVKSAMRRAGIDDPRYTAHSLRHTAATLALSAGVRLEEVQAALRHRSITTTTIYAHHLERTANAAPGAVADLIFGRPDDA